MDWRDLFEKAVGAVLVAVVIGLVALFGYGVYDAITAETFSLRKDEWRCTAEHTELTTTWMPAGKGLVPITGAHTVCDEWRRK